MMDAKPGDRLTNGPWQDRWTCPNCHHDHDDKVTKCEGCGVALRCWTENEPVSVCAIADPDEADA